MFAAETNTRKISRMTPKSHHSKYGFIPVFPVASQTEVSSPPIHIPFHRHIVYESDLVRFPENFESVVMSDPEALFNLSPALFFRDIEVKVQKGHPPLLKLSPDWLIGSSQKGNPFPIIFQSFLF
jgi:hypothetical protein